MGNIIAIKKRGGLDHIKVDKGRNVRPEIYYQKFKDRNSDGIPQGEYRGGMILDAKHFLAPHWDDVNKRWPWGSTTAKLAELIKKLKLKYESWHPEYGKIIEPGNIEQRLTDFHDPVFRHSSFYGRQFLQDSRGKFDLADPRQEFMHFVYRGSKQAIDRSKDEIVSKYTTGAVYEMVSPKSEEKKRIKGALREVEAKTLIGQLYGDDAKIRALCEAMDLPAYREQVDVEAAWLMLDEASQNTTKSAKYGKSHQDMFLELMKMDDEELNVYRQVVMARKRGHIRKWTDYYSFDGEKIHVNSHTRLVKYFQNPENQEQYIKLMQLLEGLEG